MLGWVMRSGIAVGVAALACGSIVLGASPAAAGISTIDGSPNAIAIATGTGEWAADSAIAAAATGTAVATGTAAGLAGTASVAVPGLTIGAAGAPLTTLGVALSVGGWYATHLRITGPVPGALLGGAAVVPAGWSVDPVYSDPANDGKSNVGSLRGSMSGFNGQSPQGVTVTAAVASGTVSAQGGSYRMGLQCAELADGSGAGWTVSAGSAAFQTFPVSVSGLCPVAYPFVRAWFQVYDYVTSTNLTAYWYPVGSPLRPVEAVPGHGILERDLDCIDGTGLVTHLIKAASITLSADGSYPVESMPCPSGSVSSGFGAWWTPDGGAKIEVIPWTASAPWVANIPAQQPVCMTEVCYLRLYEVGVAGAPATSCGDAAIACPEWYTDPAKTSRYECHWGPYVIDFNACSAFRKPGQVLPNTTSTTDPATGQKTGTATLVTSDPSTADDPATDPSGQPAQTPDGDACYPTGWGRINPREWVLKPVGCALSWAFVPPGGIDTTTIDTAFANSPLAQIGAMFSGVGDSFGAMSSGECGVIVDTAPAPLQGERLVISTCDPPWDQVAPLRLLISAGFMVGAVVSGTKVLLGTLRVTVHSEPTGVK